MHKTRESIDAQQAALEEFNEYKVTIQDSKGNVGYVHRYAISVSEAKAYVQNIIPYEHRILAVELMEPKKNEPTPINKYKITTEDGQGYVTFLFINATTPEQAATNLERKISSRSKIISVELMEPLKLKQMKTPRLGDHIIWRGQPAEIIGLSDGPQAIIEIEEIEICENCNLDRIVKRQFSVIISSPLFQENAEAIQTLEEG